MRNSALRADILMLITAMIWGSGFVAQRLGMENIGPLLYTGLRFSFGALVLIPLLILGRRRRLVGNTLFSKGTLKGGGWMGLALAVAINLQQVGLLFTSVTNAGFITGLYVIVVPLLGLAVGQKTGLGIWLGAGLAVLGMYLLSVGEQFQVASGDWLQLAGALVWGVHVVVVGYWARRYDVICLAFVQFVVCAALSLLLSGIFEDIHWAGIVSALPAILYGGLFAAGIGYTLQVVAQRDAIASHAAIIFSLEAVFAAIAGSLFLGEALNVRGYLGCGLMLAGMLTAQLWPKPVVLSPPKPA